MARVALAKANMPVIRSVTGTATCNFSSTVAATQRPGNSKTSTKDGKVEEINSSWWMPHPRTGIYVPRGSEWVIDDVPDHAASFTRTFWLRNVDGVEKPDPDSPTQSYLIT